MPTLTRPVPVDGRVEIKSRQERERAQDHKRYLIRKLKRPKKKKHAKTSSGLRRCEGCNATLRLGNINDYCAPCQRNPDWHKTRRR